MGINKNDLQKKLQAAFKLEAEDRLRILSSDLIKLETNSAGEKYDTIIESIFRQAHSLKGASHAVGLSDIEKIAKSLENVFSALKYSGTSVSPEIMDVVHHAIDTLTDLAINFDSTQSSLNENSVAKIVAQLNKIHLIKNEPVKKAFPSVETEAKLGEDDSSDGQSGRPSDEPSGKIIKEPRVPKEKTLQNQSVRVSLNKLDTLMLQAEEMLQAKLLANQHKIELEHVIDMLESWKKDWAQVANAAGELMRLIKKGEESGEQEKTALQSSYRLIELIKSNQNHSRLFEDQLFGLVKSAHQDQRLIGELVDKLLEDTKDVLMLPISIFLEMIPKIVRDLARDQKKNIKVILKGGTIEVDRKILEEMKDPLIHLLRNCVDHGIERAMIRKKIEKTHEGTIKVTITQESGDKILIVVSDDGAGVNIEKVKEVAIKKGVISRQKAGNLSRQEILDLIFQSELTTSAIVTDISGRGLGLAIVYEKVEKLGGKISIDSSPGYGTEFRIILPITLATFRGVLVEAEKQQFIVPTANVDRVVRVNPNDVKTVQNKETIHVNGKTVPLVRLNDVLEIPCRERELTRELIPVMILGKKEKQIAFSMDHVLDEDEVLFKSLGNQLPRVRNIYGATVLKNRNLVPILNVSDLIKSALHIRPRTKGVIVPTQKATAVQKSVLVADDSITSRMLLKTILESAGYRVKTAVDGLEAVTELKEGEYDLMVSDVDMPRMNGFVLTEKIRADKKLCDLPVILVTALHTREDREHGIDVGANAYIIKSNFDQSNLLEVIQKCI